MQKFLHEILSDLISQMSFVIKFTSATNNNDGTFTLNNICNFHHVSPQQEVTINGNPYIVKSYDYAAKQLVVEGINSIGVNSFSLNSPFFCHGTPLQTEAENAKIDDVNQKTPMIYLMEPYPDNEDLSIMSAIGSRPEFTLCFLTQAETLQWTTDEFYYNAIHPMNNLKKEVIRYFIDSYLFYTLKQTETATIYTKFGITVVESGTKKLKFSENLSGIGIKLKLEIYKVEDCEVCQDAGGQFNNSFSNQFYT